MPSPFLWRDANAEVLSGGESLAGVFSTTGIQTANTGAATAEIDISALHTLGNTEGGAMMVRIANIGTNPALYALGSAGASASFTGNTNMHLLAPNSVEIRRVDSVQVSFYHRQVTGSNTIQISVLV